jgi:hypothetical protein
VLGWLNARLHIESAEAIDWEEFASRLVQNLRGSLQASRAETAHVKVFLSTQHGSLTANLTGGAAEPVVHSRVKAKSRESEAVVNARIHMPPQSLRALVEECIHLTAGEPVATRVLNLDSFSPARPQPTHRYTRVA